MLVNSFNNNIGLRAPQIDELSPKFPTINYKKAMPTSLLRKK